MGTYPTASGEEFFLIKKFKRIPIFHLDHKPALYKVKEHVENGVGYIINIQTPKMGTSHLANEIAKMGKIVKIYGINIKNDPSGVTPKGWKNIVEIVCSTKILKDIQLAEQN